MTKKSYNSAISNERREIPNEIFFPIAVESLKTNKTVTIPLKGRSMRPFLEENGEIALITRLGKVKEGDPVLAEIEPKHWVMHRIMRIVGDDVTMMGDGNLRCEYCKLEDLRASVIGFYRRGSKKLDRTDGWKWRTYSWLWMRLLPIRRYLLSFYSRIWLKIFKPKHKI